MVTVSEILSFMETVAPGYMREEWDRVGLNCGHLDSPVSKVLIALDPFEAVCKEAKEVGAQLLLTHHALLWDNSFINDTTQTGKNALYLIENHIAHINAHTNLDCAPGGVNDTLAEVLGLTDISVIEPKGADTQENEYGLCRQGYVDETSVDDFVQRVKEALGCTGIRYVNGGKPVRKVAVGGGSCGGFLYNAAKAGCDTFVTADIKYNQFFDARDLGLNLIDAGHFHTENPVCRVLAEKLRAQFPELTVEISKIHNDCVKYG